jgi:carboxymethylenebutenolidase
LSTDLKVIAAYSILISAYDPESWSQASASISSHPSIKGAVVFGNAGVALPDTSVPILQHLAGSPTTKPRRDEHLTAYYYDSMSSHRFATPFTSDFDYTTEAVSHTRSLTFLKRRMNGPYFDLESIWDEHTYLEFEARDVPATMNTMVQEPYVNHIPTITGGIGREKLAHFYANHFIPQNPKDTELELVSRTVGIDRVIDEFIYKFTHDMQIDWLYV